MATPVVYPYQRALDAFRREGREGVLLKRMSELISLLDLTVTLGGSLSATELLDAALLIVMGELQVSRAALFVRAPDGSYYPRAARGKTDVAPFRPPSVPLEPRRRGEPGFVEPGGSPEFEIVVPVMRGDVCMALFLLGPRALGQVYGEEELSFLRSVAACSATPVENGLVYAELRDVNLRLSRKIFELKNLFDLNRELTSTFDEQAIRSLFVATVMGHLVVSRASLFLGGVDGLRLVHERGVRGVAPTEAIPEGEARKALRGLERPLPVNALPVGPVRELLEKRRLTFVFPLSAGDRLEGFVAVSERASRTAFGEEDDDFVRTLGRQTLAALDTVRLHQVEVDKEKQDRELQIAREIQQSLFPAACPRVAGFSLAAASRACFEVGGDHYDFIPLEDGRLAFAVADVSGKGTPASILMASVHASLRALAGSAPPAALVTRLDHFLFENTQANKYVTLFYGELEPSSRRLRYVTAGHIPPYLLRASGGEERLTEGGPAIGLLEGASFTEGEARLEKGDALVVVTDGATEAMRPDGEDLGDAGVCRALRSAGRGSADDLLQALLTAVDRFTGEAGCSDDLTALILKAEEP